MCRTPKQWGFAILAAILGAIFAILFFSAVVQQFVNRGVLSNSTETWYILAQYFVSMVFLGAAKHCKWKACCDEKPNVAKKKR